MKIQFCSDLHLEFKDLEIPNAGADMLVLAGDILVAEDLYRYSSEINDPSKGPRHLSAHRFRKFLKMVSENFQHVVYVAGNHEFYHGKFLQTIEILRGECSKFPNIHFLDGEFIDIGNTRIVGGTLWTDCNKGCPTTMYHLTSFMNDYQVIRVESHGYRKLRPSDTTGRHSVYLKKFRDYIQSAEGKKVVVVSHHAPSTLSISPEYKDDYYTNGGYASDLSEFILDHSNVSLWIHGHVHTVFDYTIGETRIVTNPRGYPSENTGWDPNKILEV